MEKLFISIDPGCDAFKVVVNKKLFSISSNVEEVVLKDLRSLVGALTPEKYLVCSKDGTSFAIGELAKKHIAVSSTHKSFDARQNLNKKVNDGEAYFVSQEFEIGIETMIGYAMYMYANENNLNINDVQKYEVYCAITLPHSSVNDFSTPVIEKIARKHDYKLTIGPGNEIAFNYSIKKENTFTMSQVISAIMGELLDDEGNALEEVAIKNFPALVLDGGYRTLGIVNVREDFFIDEREAESNENYAMFNVNEKVSNIVKSTYGVIMPEYMVEQNISKGEYEQKYLKPETNKFGVYNLKEIKDNSMEELVRQLVSYLDTKYGQLLETKCILATGGTGKAYHKILKDIYVNEREQFKEEQIVLTNAPFDGKPCDAVYAIAVGGYKAMLTAISK